MDSRRGQEGRARLGQTFGEMSYNVPTLCLRGVRLMEWETRYPRNIRRIIGPFPRQIGQRPAGGRAARRDRGMEAEVKLKGRQGRRASDCSFLYIYYRNNCTSEDVIK